MTFGLLIANAHNNEFKEQIENNYHSIGYYYDHFHNTSGFVFREKELEVYVKEHKVDPASIGGNGLINFADSFVVGISNLKIIVIKEDHKLSTDILIVKNYKRFQLFESNE